MSKTTVSPFAGGSVIVAAREVIAADEVLRVFGGSRSELALAAGNAARETDEAVEADRPAKSVNLTAEWFKTNYATVYPLLVQHLSMKMARSRELGVAEDHVQEFVARLVAKDTLASYLTKGENPKLSVLRVWAYQSACTEIRRWGVDADARTTRCAKTSREVQQGRAWHVIQSADTAREVSSKGGEDESCSTHDLYDPEASSPEDISTRRSQLINIRRMLTRSGHGKLIPVVDGLLEGKSLTELMATCGVSQDQILTVLGNLRN